MIDKIYQKIRALVEDFQKSDFQVFTYANSTIFTLIQENINTITAVLKNGTALGSGDYSYDSTTNKITITVSLSSGDLVEVDFTYDKYSDTELLEYIRASLVWLSIYAYCATDYELESEEIFPTPDNRTIDLVSLIASIIIKPNYSRYSLPNVTVIYPRKLDKEEKIQRLISRFKMGLGVNDTIEFD